MLSYQHAYHAGNHADILKHIALIQCLRRLNLKEAPYSVFDTHAGRGLYSVSGAMAEKTGEAKKGVLALQKFVLEKKAGGFAEGEKIPECVDFYLSLVGPFLKEDLYPGSPLIVRELKRNGDFHSLCELHPAEHEALLENARNGKNPPAIFHADGLKKLFSSCPPKIKRGLAIIDPPYEDEEEYEAVTKTIIGVHKKWSAGTILLWYPLLDHRKGIIENMTETIKAHAAMQNKNTAVVQKELLVSEEGPSRLYGSGVLVLNAPYQLEEQLEEAVQFLERFFAALN